jgi:hypothetical protein
MARATPTAIVPTLTGAVLALSAAPVDGDILSPGDTYLIVNNGSGGSITVTIQTTATKGGLDVADAGGPVAAGVQRVFGPLPSSLFAQASDAVTGPNKVLVDYSAVTTVTRAVLAV